jgi:hypothetical protein
MDEFTDLDCALARENGFTDGIWTGYPQEVVLEYKRAKMKVS